MTPIYKYSTFRDLQLVLQTFEESIAHIKTLVLQEFDREIAEKQLCYHTREHVAGVQQRASVIFRVVSPYLPPSDDCARLELLLDLCAVAHDRIQIFVPQTEPHVPRRREAGVSETATVEWLLGLLTTLQQSWQHSPDQSAPVTERDFQVIQEAIAATICDYDPVEQAIFQPALYDREHSISPVARILALADIGALGMEGIEAYNLEGSLLFLEENPDVRSLIENHQFEQRTANNPTLAENIRQRLLKRARFQVSFAKSRLSRCSHELEGFPPEVIPVLSHDVFQHLTPTTIQTIEATTPTAEDTSLETLISFFRFEQIMAGIVL